MKTFWKKTDEVFDEHVGFEWRGPILVLAIFAYLAMC